MLKRSLFALPVLIFLVVAGYFLWGLAPGRDPSAVPSALIDKPVPKFELGAVPGLETPGLSTADFGGKVMVVNFFASWCIPCRAEHPLLTELAQDSDIVMVGIDYRDQPADAIAWLAELGNPYARIGADLNGRTGIDWGVSGVPETFIVDKSGRIRYQHIGPVMDRDLNNTLRPLIEELK